MAETHNEVYSVTAKGFVKWDENERALNFMPPQNGFGAFEDYGKQSWKVKGNQDFSSF
jgi:hypothetical protein